jgi:hypothetical protein
MLANLNNVSFTSKSLRTGMLRVRAKELGVPIEKMGEHGYVIPKTRPLPSFNPAEYEIIPTEVNNLEPKEITLFLRDLYSQTKKQLRQVALKAKAKEFGIPVNESTKPLSAEEQPLLSSVKRKLDFLIALNRAK